MINLAGNRDADTYVKSELEAAGITIVDHEGVLPGEVPTRLSGVLRNFTFKRYWYYWVVKGPMPLDVAEKIYANPIGQDTVRAAGHAGRVPPAEEAEIRTPEGHVVTIDPTGEQQKEWVDYCQRRGLPVPTNQVFVKDLSEVPGYKAFVDSYHIDSAEGLKLFVDAVKSLPTG